jgi:hypothetical protein
VESGERGGGVVVKGERGGEGRAGVCLRVCCIAIIWHLRFAVARLCAASGNLALCSSVGGTPGASASDGALSPQLIALPSELFVALLDIALCGWIPVKVATWLSEVAGWHAKKGV